MLLAIISELAGEKPEELVRLAVVRARFCELLAGGEDNKKASGELFLTGLFSLIDAMLDRSMESLLKEMPISDRVKNALISRTGPYAATLEAVEAYERGNTGLCRVTLRKSGGNADDLGDVAVQAMEYGQQLLDSF